jgi:SAM-dependent methyltransferase
MSHTPASQDAQYRSATQSQVEQLLRKKNYHSLTLPDGTEIPGLISVEALERRIRAFPIPESLVGRRVLDVGAASGWNSLEMARRGADVMAVDCVEFEELRTATELFDLAIDYRILDVDELDGAVVGDFDYVLFLGVLYHLRHPLLALEKICALTRETAFVESFVTDSGDAPSEACTLEFYETDQLGGQIDNWFGPTAKCLVALCRAAGFVRVKLEYVATERRAGVTCHRRWEPEPPSSNVEPAWLYSAVNNRTNDVAFYTGKDEYLCIYFRSGELGLTTDRMRIEVDGYGVNALTLHDLGKGDWQVNSRLPPGLAPGEHVVRLRTDATRFGNEFRIQLLDSRSGPAPLQAAPEMAASSHPAPAIYSLENSLNRSRILHGYKSERLVCRFRGGQRSLSRESVFACLDEEPIPIAFLTDLAHGEWQANVELPRELAPGSHSIRIRTLASGWSDPAEFLFEP